MNYKKDQGSFYFLYKLTPGVSASFAFEVAETIGVDKNILLRAREILRGLRNNEIIQPLKENIRTHNSKNLTKLNVPKPDED
ncbi:hypothetical protein NQ318_008118 [Aromia moschata]|uniref:Uncharacterized protein n=1 Tax=Aromia moschata TaxID=1265417 RepID=A0AAV8YPV1_9CUCU|nr:hypothetical protein NQ318_008118 [Aromia moschata]